MILEIGTTVVDGAQRTVGGRVAPTSRKQLEEQDELADLAFEEDKDEAENDVALRYSIVTRRTFVAPPGEVHDAQVHAVASWLLNSQLANKAHASASDGTGGNETDAMDVDHDALPTPTQDELKNFFAARSLDQGPTRASDPVAHSASKSINHAVSTRSAFPVDNRTTSRAEALTCAFVTSFPLGQVHDGNKVFSVLQQNHMLSQWHRVIARDRFLIAYMFDEKRRLDTVHGVSAMAKSHSYHFDKAEELINDENFQARLQAALQHPSAKDSKAILKVVSQCLSLSGRNQAQGSQELQYILPRIRELAKTRGPACAFITLAPSMIGNQRLLRMSQIIASNAEWAARLDAAIASGSTEGLDALLRKLCGENLANGQDDYFIPVDVDQSARASAAINDPAASVEEFMSFMNVILTRVLGLPPEQFFTHLQGPTSRKTSYVGGTMTPFGRIWSYYGVIEANNRGDLHMHLLLFGSIPTSVLQDLATFRNVCEQVKTAMASYYKSELSAEWLLFNAVKENLPKRSFGATTAGTFRFPPPPEPHFAHRGPIEALAAADGTTVREKIDRITACQTAHQQVHRHLIGSCTKGHMGHDGCRFSMPQLLNDGPCVVELREKPLQAGEKRSKTDACWEPHDVSNAATVPSRSPLDVQDHQLLYWDLARRPQLPLPAPCDAYAEYIHTGLEDGLLQLTDAEKAACSETIIDFLRQRLPTHPIVTEELFESLQVLSFDRLIEFYKKTSDSFAKKNGYVVVHSPLLSLLIGCHNNTAPLGCSEQSKSVALYIGPYFMKEKYSVEECLSVLLKTHAHIKKYPSTAEDTGTRRRRTLHFLERTLNQLSLLIEVSDLQAIAALRRLPVQIRSDAFAMCHPQETFAFVVDALEKRNKPMSVASSDDSTDANSDHLSDFIVPDHESPAGSIVSAASMNVSEINSEAMAQELPHSQSDHDSSDEDATAHNLVEKMASLHFEDSIAVMEDPDGSAVRLDQKNDAADDRMSLDTDAEHDNDDSDSSHGPIHPGRPPTPDEVTFADGIRRAFGPVRVFPLKGGVPSWTTFGELYIYRGDELRHLNL